MSWGAVGGGPEQLVLHCHEKLASRVGAAIVVGTERAEPQNLSIGVPDRCANSSRGLLELVQGVRFAPIHETFLVDVEALGEYLDQTISGPYSEHGSLFRADAIANANDCVQIVDL